MWQEILMSKMRVSISFLLSSLLLLSSCDTEEQTDASIANVEVASHENKILMPASGWGVMQFETPEPGSYNLPPFGVAADGNVLNEDGQEMKLSDFYGDKIVILSFIYTQCSDLNGCPLVTAVFYKLKQALMADPVLEDQLRLISLSFDPEYDTPEVMRFYGQGSKDFGELEWQFLTTKSTQELTPIVEGFGQYVNQEYDEDGNKTGNFAHILRVFLIDKNGVKRSQYSAGFLHEESLISDVKTLLLEEQKG